MESDTAPEQARTPGYSDELQAFIDEAPLERTTIVEFIAEAARKMPDGTRVLDIGAGSAPYRELLAHTVYATSDWSQSMHVSADSLDVVGPADDLPVPDASYDAIICTQVLEHVSDPGAVLREMARILVDDGALYLTAPLTWEEHEMPHDYFRYTRSGLSHLLSEAGFTNTAITARTDTFTTLSQLLTSSRWSLGELVDDESQPDRQRVVDRIDEIAAEVATFAPYDGRRVFPLGYTVEALRPPRPAVDGEAAAARVVDAAPDAGPKTSAVLYLAPWVDLGGSDKGTIDWFKHIDRDRWKPSLITTQPSANRWVPALAPYADEVWNLPEFLPGSDFARFVLDFIVSREVEVVHIMNSRLAFDLLPDISALPNAPVVVVQLHAEEPDRSGYVRYSSTRYGNIIDAFSVTSQQLADAMLDFDVPPSKLRVITTGVDGIDEFAPENVEPFDLPGSAPRILWPGRLVQQKDPMLTLDVLRLLVDRGVDFVLDVVGDGEMSPAVKARATELGLDRFIAWHPPSHEMPRWYRSADLLLMTSVFEGVPYVMYEALAMGVPVVVPAIPGNVEFLDAPDSGGILIEPRDDAAAYADAIERLLRDDEARVALGTKARERMLREFTLPEMGAQHDALYEELLASRPARPVATELAPKPVIRFPRDPLPERSVAVIVPCYRHGHFLEDAIASIHAQTITPDQIIVVDDASPDRETIEALARLDRDPRVQVLRMAKNGGPSVARNRALAEVRTNYVLPLDADDLLLSHALEDMIGQLEEAGDDIGFVYPNAQHFGNRHDYYAAPAYNLHLLMQANYCPATTMFDMRVFAHGVAYPEHLLHGHEDWDLILQMAAHGVHGVPAEVPTFLYRKAGFSRITSVEFRGRKDEPTVAELHPELFEHQVKIKAEWAPALTVILDGAPGSVWQDDVIEAFRAQTCQDFEIVTAGSLLTPRQTDPVVVSAGEATGLQSVADAIETARGRFIVVLDEQARGLIDRPTFVESTIRILWANHALPHFVIAAIDGKMPPLTQLTPELANVATPVGAAWRREEGVALRPLELEPGIPAVESVAMSWELEDAVQWRSA